MQQASHQHRSRTPRSERRGPQPPTPCPCRAAAGCVVTTLILEGWSNKLAPEHSVLVQVQNMFSPALLPWGDRITSVVDVVMDRGDTALVMT
jgi:hypothetical protein